jgi:L-rhamnonate dehydratase
MRITNVRAVQPDSPGCPPDWRTSMGQILVAIDTDRGLTGYGVGGGGAAGLHVVRTVLRDLLLDEDPAPVEVLWERMYRATLPFGRKGLAIMAVSGVDLALWDLRGKAAGQPVAVLLGGQVGRPIPAYATVGGDPRQALQHGYRAIKLHVGFMAPAEGQERIVQHVSQVREQVGPGVQLMLDAFMRWDVPTTRRMAELLASSQLEWLEEPLLPDDLAGYAQLTGSPIPIAGGEHEYTAAAFAEIIERRLHQVLQPDVCWCGGMTELVKIYAMARRAGLRVCPHRGGELWGLHAVAALDPQPLAESGRPWMTWVGGQPEVRDGTLTLGDAPGFGAVIEDQ